MSSEPATWGDGTRSVRAGEDPAVPGAPLRPSPVFAAPFHLGDQPPRAGGADAYARTEHPTLRAFEAAVGELDGGRCLSFATGMAAISAAVLAFVGSRRPGGAAVRRLLHDPAAGRRRARRASGSRSSTCPRVEIEAFAAAGGLDGVRLVLLETPSNPQLDVCDIAAVARAARAAGALVAVDNTTATPARPAPAGARRAPHGRQRHQGADRTQRPAARPREHDRRRAVRPAGAVAGPQRQHAGPVRGVARPPVDEHPGPAAGAAGGQRGRGGRGAGGVVRWSAACAGRGAPDDPSYDAGEPADAAAQRGGVGRARGRGGRRPPPRGHPAVDRRDQLRRRAQHGRPAGAVGRRRRRRRGSSGCPAGSRTPTTWSTT